MMNKIIRSKPFYKGALTLESTQTHMTDYLDLKQVAAKLGLTYGTLRNRTDLPAPDVVLGKSRGWTAETIDQWIQERRKPD
jgi:predicted DNA-binding transcriptional regulator AlpA